MKKTYISPTMRVKQVVIEHIMAGSITSIGGDTDLEIGEGDPPSEADAKGTGGFNVWED